MSRTAVQPAQRSSTAGHERRLSGNTGEGTPDVSVALPHLTGTAFPWCWGNLQSCRAGVLLKTCPSSARGPHAICPRQKERVLRAQTGNFWKQGQ